MTDATRREVFAKSTRGFPCHDRLEEEMRTRLRDETENRSERPRQDPGLPPRQSADGFDPSRIEDRLYFDHPARQAFVPLDNNLYNEIQGGLLRV